MSLDHTHDALMRFSADLARFNETLAALERDLAERHASIEGLWKDESRLTYDRAFAEYRVRLRTYSLNEAPRFEAFLQEKRRNLEQYLRGGR